MPTRRVLVLPLMLALALTACTGVDTSDGPTASPSASETSVASPSATAQALDAVVSDGPYETELRTYRLDDITVPSGSVPVEVQGRVVGPVDVPAGSAGLPLVVLLHGYSGSCWQPSSGDTSTEWPCPQGWKAFPSDAGFDYLQQRLASQGYLTVSLSGNGVNVVATQMDDDAGAQARSVLVRRHLEGWSTGEVGLEELWPNVDLTRVLLVGHSRGGEGVDRAAADSVGERRWRIAGTVLLGPTAFEPPQRSVVPLVTLTGYCDGDVGPGPAQRLVDRPGDDALLRTAVIVSGANHNFFNSEWTPGESSVPGGADDAYLEDGSVSDLCDPEGGQRISAGEQRDVAQRMLGVAAAPLLRADAAALAVLDGRVAGPWAPGTDVHLAATANGRQTLVPGVDLTPDASGGMAARLCRGVSETTDERACGFGSNEGLSVHWPDEYRETPAPDAVQLTWDAPGAVDLSLTQPLDLTDTAGIEARIAIVPPTGPVSFELTLTDAEGASEVIGTSEAVQPFPDDPVLPPRRWGQRVFVALPSSVGIDLTQVTGVSFAPSSDEGKAWVVDVSALPPTASS
jgi:dienelactone hydrolase